MLIKKNNTKRKATEDLFEPAKRLRLIHGYGALNLETEKESSKINYE